MKKQSLREMVDDFGGPDKFAVECGMSPRQMQNILNGHSLPRFLSLQAMADTLGIGLTELGRILPGAKGVE